MHGIFNMLSLIEFMIYIQSYNIDHLYLCVGCALIAAIYKGKDNG